MDPMNIINITTSISGVVEYGQKISVGLLSTFDAVRNAPRELKRISDDIYTLCGLFEQMKSLVNEPQSVPGGKSFHLKNGPLATAIENCKATFTEIEAVVKNFDREIIIKGKVRISRSVLLRSNWPLQRGKLREMTQDLEKTKTTLILGLQVARVYKSRLISEATTNDTESKQDLLHEVAAAEAAIVSLYQKQATRVNHQAKEATEPPELVTPQMDTMQLSPSVQRHDSTHEPPELVTLHMDAMQRSPSIQHHDSTGEPLELVTLHMDAMQRSPSVQHYNSTGEPPKQRVAKSVRINEPQSEEVPSSKMKRAQQTGKHTNLQAWFTSSHPCTNWQPATPDTHPSLNYLKLGFGGIDCHISALNVAQSDILSILEEKTSNGNISSFQAMQKLNQQQRSLVAKHTQSTDAEILWAGEWENVSSSTLFGDLMLVSILWITRPLRGDQVPQVSLCGSVVPASSWGRWAGRSAATDLPSDPSSDSESEYNEIEEFEEGPGVDKEALIQNLIDEWVDIREKNEAKVEKNLSVDKLEIRDEDS